MSNNSYTIEKSDINYSGGRYISSSPYAAGKKAASQLFRKINNEDKYKKFKSVKTITFTLRESTAGSNKKEFIYKAKQVKLDKPIIIDIKGVKIEYKYKIDIESLNKLEKPVEIKSSKPKFAMSGGCGDMSGGTCAMPTV